MSVFRAGLSGIAFLALSACASTREPPDPFILTIDAGRLSMMTDKSSQMLGSSESIGVDETDAQSRAKMADDLRRAVQELSRVKMDACPQAKLSPALCKSDYAPSWALRRDPEPPSWKVLEARIDDAKGPVMDAWAELCEAKRTQNPVPTEEEIMEVCSIE